jgi:enterochelin esterase family protein
MRWKRLFPWRKTNFNFPLALTAPFGTQSIYLIKLEKHIITDAATGLSRPIHLLRGPTGQPHRLCLFLDGELYFREMKAVPVISALLDPGTRPHMTFAFLDHGSLKAREQDYTCNEDFGRFIAETVIHWLQQEIPGLHPGQHLIGGVSLSGLMSAWLALRYPEHFRYCLSQSGAFWWNDEFFTKTAPQRAPADTRFWLSVGDQETEVDDTPPGSLPEVSQIVGVKNACRFLKSLGATVNYHEYHGGHSMPCWRDELNSALTWLLTSSNH